MSLKPVLPRAPIAPVSEPAPAWRELAGCTPARIALGRSGVSLPTREVLAFGVAHAQARDAVHAPLDVGGLRAELQDAGWATLEVASAAPDRAAYLARPDRGRRLDAASRERLQALAAADAGQPAPHLALVLSDGLSSIALRRHAAPLLAALRPLLDGLRLAPLVIATQARVALADEVGEVLGAAVVATLIGERPGLSAADSLGIYLTAAPRVGRSDAERDCISNIHGAGLGYAPAAQQCAELVRSALRSGCSGVAGLRAAERATLAPPEPDAG